MGYEELLVNIPQKMQYFKGHWLLPAITAAINSENSSPTIEKYNQGSLVELAITFTKKRRMMLKFTTTKRLADSRKPKWSLRYRQFIRVLLDYALKSYQIASDLEPKYNFNYQKAYFMVN
jgi:hypothetical protein